MIFPADASRPAAVKLKARETPVFGEGELGYIPVSFPEVDVESGEVTDKWLDEATRRGVEGTPALIVDVELSILALALE